MWLVHIRWDGQEGPGRVEEIILGDPSRNTWIGIVSTSTPGDTEGTSGGEVNFRSYNDFILDNFRIEEIEITSEVLLEVSQQEVMAFEEEAYTEESIRTYQNAAFDLLTMNPKETSAEDIANAVEVLETAKANLEYIPYKVNASQIENAVGPQQNDSEAFIRAFDHDLSTIWHTQ